MKFHSSAPVRIMSPEALYAARKMREAAEWEANRECRRWRARLLGFAASLLFIAIMLALCLAITGGRP